MRTERGITIATALITSRAESFWYGKVQVEAFMETSTLRVQWSAVHSGQLKLTVEKLVPLLAPRTGIQTWHFLLQMFLAVLEINYPEKRPGEQQENNS